MNDSQRLPRIHQAKSPVVVLRHTPITVAGNVSRYIKTLAALISASQMNLSEISRKSGITQPTLYRWFRGDCLPNIENYVAVMTVLGATLVIRSPHMPENDSGDSGPGWESSAFDEDRNQEIKAVAAQTPEGRVKDAVKKILKDAGAWWFMPVQTGFGVAELDFLCTHPKTGKLFVIETKSPEKYLTSRQGVLVEKHIKAGHGVFIIDGSENERSAGQGYFVTPLGLFKKYLDSSE